MTRPRVFVLDQEDSFVHILAERIAVLDAEVVVHRTDLGLPQLERELHESRADVVVLSPGPGHPRDAEPALSLLRSPTSRPVLGVCLGMQTMALACGGEVTRAPRPMHGKRSQIDVVDHPLFDGLPHPIQVGRYHSLCVSRVPPEFAVLAVTREVDRDNGVVMAIAHRTRPWIGLQFHPESVLTPDGETLLRNALHVLCGSVVQGVER